MISLAIILLIVVVVLCGIVGSIYAYLYFTRINPRTGKGTKYMESGTQDDDGGQGRRTHLFLFKR